MKHHEFGERSQRQLDTMHPDLQLIFTRALLYSRVDFGISEGHRSIDRQYQLYLEDKTTIDGITRMGKHNFLPSEAGDIYIWHPVGSLRKRMAFDHIHLSYVAGVIQAAAEELLREGVITHRVRWGGNWDSDGVIQFDQKFQDLPHFEIVPV